MVTNLIPWGSPYSVIVLCLNCFEDQPGNDADAAVAVGDDAMPRKPIGCTQVYSLSAL